MVFLEKPSMNHKLSLSSQDHSNTHSLPTQNHNNYYAWLNQRSQILDFEMTSEGQFSLSLSLSLCVSIKETIEFWTFRLIAQLKITNPRF